MNQQHHPRRRGPLAMLAVGLLVALGPASASVADPTNPSDAELKQARNAVVAGTSAVADIEIQLAQLSATRDAAYSDAAVAGEAYLLADQSRIDAEAAATQAATDFSSARADMETARRMLVQIALQASRSGGAMDSIEAFLSADGFDDVVERSTALSRLGTRADRAVQEFRATKLVADALSGRATKAVAERSRTAAAAKSSLDAANKAQGEADAAVTAVAAQRETLIVQLAAARSTTAAIERARQDQLDLDRAARASAAAQAVRTAATPSAVTPAAPQPTSPAKQPSGSTPPATTPPASDPPASTPPASTPPASNPPASTPPTGTTTPTGSSRGSAAQGAAAVAWISGQLGLDYGWGSTGPTSYDCSGLTQAAWRHAGLSINRTSSTQYKQSLKISYNDLRPGDLVFWGTDANDWSSVYHVAMWVGNGLIAEAPRPGVTTRITAMRWTNAMPSAGRP